MRSVRIRTIELTILLFFLFFYLYGVHFSFLPTYTSRLIVMGAIAYMLVFLINRTRVILPFDFVIVGVAYGAYLSWVLMSSSIYGFSDITILAFTLFLLFHAFLGGVFFAIFFKKMAFSFYQFIFFLQIIIVLQAFFIILYFVSWDFREFTFTYIPETGNVDHKENLFRSRGLTNGVSATLSLVQSIGLLFTAYLVSQVSYKSKKFIYLLVTFGLIFLSVFLTGRTGLLMLPVVLIYLLTLLLVKERFSKNTIYFLLGLPVVFVLMFIMLKTGYQYILGGFTTQWGEDGFSRLVRWVTSEFVSSDGQIQSRTAQILMSHWFTPDSLKSFLFGDPTTWNLDRIPSDIGIVRLLHGVGLIGMLLFYVLFSLIFLISVIRARGYEAKLLIIFLAIFLFMAEFKEPFLTKLQINAFIMLIFCFLVLSRDATFRRVGSLK